MEPTIEQNANIERPREVSRALQVITLSLVIGLITSLFQLTQKVSGRPMILAALIVVVFFGFGFLLISRIAARRNWARIVWLVLIVFGLPFAIPSNLQEIRRNVLSGIFSVIVTLLQLIGTYLLFTKNSNLWFRTRK
jgi:hypothetical protein